MIAGVRAGKRQKQTADDFGIHPVTLSKRIDFRHRPRASTGGVVRGPGCKAPTVTSSASKTVTARPIGRAPIYLTVLRSTIR